MQVFDAFISYSTIDKKKAQALATELQKLGLEIWFDQDQIDIGKNLIEEVQIGIKSSRYCIILVSHNYFKSKWPEAEWSAFFEKEKLGEKIILPVLDNISHQELKDKSPLLSARKAIRLGDGIKEAAQLIAEVIKNIDVVYNKSLNPDDSETDLPSKDKYHETNKEGVTIQQQNRIKGKLINPIFGYIGQQTNDFKEES